MEDSARSRTRGRLAARYDRDWLGTPVVQPYTHFWRFPNSAAGAARAALGRVTGQHVLELASGAGTHALALAHEGAHVTATELSPAGLRALTQASTTLARPPRCVLCDATRLPFSDRSFDLVTGENFLMHVEPALVLAECYRVLRPGGRVVLLEPTAHHPVVRLYRRFASPYRYTRPRYLTHRELAAAATQFTTARLETFYLLTVLTLPLARYRNLFGAAFRMLDGADGRLLNRWPRLRRYTWLAVVALDKPGRVTTPFASSCPAAGHRLGTRR